VPGKVDDPRVVKGMEEATAKIRAAGKAAGTFADDVEKARRWRDVGVQYVSLGVDTGIFARACRDIVEQMKGV